MISQKTKDYLKCVYTNKATLAGYLLLPTSASLAALGHNSNSTVATALLYSLSANVGVAGYSLLCATSLGEETLKSYLKTRNHIKKFGKIKEDYQEIRKERYCSRVGMRLAVKEAGLEGVLKR